MGFNGIPVALLGASSPIGIIFAAIFISYIQVGGEALQPEYAKEIIDIIIAVIIYLSAFSLLVKNILGKFFKGDTSNVNDDGAAVIKAAPPALPAGEKAGESAGEPVGVPAGEPAGEPAPVDTGEKAVPVSDADVNKGEGGDQ